MKTVSFYLDKSKFTINCPEQEEQKLLDRAKEVDAKIKSLKQHFVDADQKTLLAICCLLLQDEAKSNHQEEFEAEKQEIFKQAKELFEQSKTQIETLAKKIENY